MWGYNENKTEKKMGVYAELEEIDAITNKSNTYFST